MYIYIYIYTYTYIRCTQRIYDLEDDLRENTGGGEG